MPENKNMRTDIFSLDNGTVTIEWPAGLSMESYQDVCVWINLVKQKMERSIKTPAKQEREPDPAADRPPRDSYEAASREAMTSLRNVFK